MLSAPAVDFNFDDDDWSFPCTPKLYRAASVGSWGVTSIGRGFDWTEHDDRRTDSSERTQEKKPEPISQNPPISESGSTAKTESTPHERKHNHSSVPRPLFPSLSLSPPPLPPKMSSPLIPQDTLLSRPLPRAPSPSESVGSFRPPSRSSSSPRPRRRSSQQRVSLIAGRVSIAPIEPPSPPPMLPHSLTRSGSTGSLLSVSASTRAPSPSEDRSFLGGRSISEFLIEGEIGRGAYGLVKRAREIYADGSFGVSLIVLALRVNSLKLCHGSHL